MKKSGRFFVILAFLLAFSAVYAQTETVELLAVLDAEAPFSRMVWNETGDVITILTRDSVDQVVVSDPDESNSYDLGEKNYFFTALSETGVVASLSSDGQTIYIYEPGNGEKAVQTIEPGFKMLSVSVSKDGTQVLADSAEQIRSVVFDTADGSVVNDLTGFGTAAPVYDSCLSSDKSRVIWHSRGTFAVQDAEDGSFGKTISLWDFASAYELSPDNEVLAVAIINDDYENGAVLFFNPQSGEELGRVLLGETAPFDLSFSADGSILWAADADTVYMIDPENFELKAQIKVSENTEESRISRIASSPDGQSLAILMNNGELLAVKF